MMDTRYPMKKLVMKNIKFSSQIGRKLNFMGRLALLDFLMIQEVGQNIVNVALSKFIKILFLLLKTRKNFSFQALVYLYILPSFEIASSCSLYLSAPTTQSHYTPHINKIKHIVMSYIQNNLKPILLIFYPKHIMQEDTSNRHKEKKINRNNRKRRLFNVKLGCFSILVYKKKLIIMKGSSDLAHL